MGCGYGACVGCTVEVKGGDPSLGSGIVRRKVCTDGPVFPAETVVW
jgi:dihydroorotate dehydrogenase electron transfer subunit